MSPLPQLELTKPLAERLREQGPSPEQIATTTASIDELAALWKCEYAAAWARVWRRGWQAIEMGRAEGAGRPLKRVYVSQLPGTDQKMLARLRRKALRAGLCALPEGAPRSSSLAVANGENLIVPAHHGGLVVRDDDRRVKVDTDLEEKIWALYGRREKPGYGWVFRGLTHLCCFCGQAEMLPVYRGYKGRHASRQCPACSRSLSYATVRRACRRMPPELQVATRDGWNAYRNKFGFKGKIQRGVYRNHIVVGDHHQLDLMAHDPQGHPKEFRLWLSAWQDEATGVVAWALGERPNMRLLMDALYRYIVRFGLPDEIRTDNGKDYLAADFQRFYKAAGVRQHHRTIPSCRTGESHGKSKIIERWFGTFERDCMKFLPGWCGSHPKERPDDVLWPQRKEHGEFLAGIRAESPFLTVKEVFTAIEQWVEGVFHQTPTKRLEAQYGVDGSTPALAHERDPHAVRTLDHCALRVLMLEPHERVIGANGVSVDTVNYWHPQFAGLRGMSCDARIDADDLNEAIVIVKKPGKADQVLSALAEREVGSKEDLRKVKHIQKAERQLARDFYDMQHRRLAGEKTWDQVLAAKGDRARERIKAVVGIPIIGEAHHLANAIDRAPRAVGPSRARQQAVPLDDGIRPFVMPEAPDGSGENNEPSIREPWERE